MQMSLDGESTNGGGTTMVADALKGAVAGAIGVWVMDQVDWFNFEHEDPAARRLTKQVRPRGMDPAHVLANTAAEALGTELSPPQPHPLGVAIHYSLGVGPGALYAVTRERLPGSGPMRGALYGLGLFVLQDEVLNSLMGIAARPGKYPWQAHARGCVAHLVYGVVTDTVLSVLKGPGRLIRNSSDEQATAVPGRQTQSGTSRRMEEARPAMREV